MGRSPPACDVPGSNLSPKDMIRGDISLAAPGCWGVCVKMLAGQPSHLKGVAAFFACTRVFGKALWATGTRPPARQCQGRIQKFRIQSEQGSHKSLSEFRSKR
ncbi:hypothetical protein LA080_011209 [Diaporthe eres]|nr:hypothetical protein LA080_011209 [Diaporthe eres]